MPEVALGMTQLAKQIPFGGRILMLGCGSVGQCTLPLIRRHLDMPATPEKLWAAIAEGKRLHTL